MNGPCIYRNIEKENGVSFDTALETARHGTEAVLHRLLPSTPFPKLDPALSRLHEAMRYAVLSPGKRFRAYLVLASADLFEVPRSYALRVAGAVECMHAYSLVHDDLPVMDNDDLRRGRPTLHRAFGDAVAILAGDALQSLAFGVLVDPATHPDAAIRTGLVARLADAAGADGMAGGQMMDMYPAGGKNRVRTMQTRKTGAIIRFCCCSGGVLGNASADAMAALDAYGRGVGLAYQIRDDLLDLSGKEGEVGKRLGKDQEAGKATLAEHCGEKGAQGAGQRLLSEAMACLDRFGSRGTALRMAANFVMERNR